MKFAGNQELTYKQSLALTKSLSQYVDFGYKEQALLLDIWHMKVNLLLKSLHKERVEQEEVLSCDGPKYWLEEAQ